MRVERDPADLRTLAPAQATLAGGVRDIVEDVRANGDAALKRYTARFDGASPPLRVAAEELAAAREALDGAVAAGLETAIANVRAVAAAGLADDREVALPQGHSVTLRELPVRRAAIYVPGGRNPYPSTVVMGVVTAQVAGVGQVAVCAPGAHPVILGACALCGVDEVWRFGGAHGVAALAYGTASVERVDVLAGPGGPYVQEAKRQVSGAVGIDMFAGPSDLLVIADGDVDADAVIADLLAQAEHGAGTVVALVTPDRDLLAAAEERLGAAEGEAVCALVEAGGDAALEIAERFAPEHLHLAGERAEALAPRVRASGCVLVGTASGTAFSDYVAGSNHTLPTAGAARFASGLNVRHFRRRVSEVRIPAAAAAALAQAGAPIAEAEGFTAHAASMRLRENGAR